MFTKQHKPKSTEQVFLENEEELIFKEAMKKFNLTRESVYNTLRFHEIKREKKGRFVKFLKVDFDRVMGVKK